MRVYELLGSEREGPGLNQAMAQAMHLDRGQLSALETRASDDRAAGLKLTIAEAALAAGASALRRQDWKGVSGKLGRDAWRGATGPHRQGRRPLGDAATRT